MEVSCRTLLSTVLLMLPSIALSSDDPSADIQRWTAFVEQNQYGDDPDYWLATVNTLGDIERVAVVFGMWGDEGFCRNLVTAYKAMYPNTSYFCYRAN